MVWRYCLILGLLIVLTSNTESKALNENVLSNAFQNINSHPFKPVSQYLALNSSESQSCNICNLVVPLIKQAIKNADMKTIFAVVEFVCAELKIEDKTVCTQIVDLYGIANETTLNPREVCSIFLNCAPIVNPLVNWNITLPSVPKPPVVPPYPPIPGSPTIRILHLSDIHIDFEYQPGALAECGQPLCCRNSSTLKNKRTKRTSTNQTAGYWGDYRNCDVPLWTVESMFDHISRNEEFDFVYWTGDLPPHNVWNQSKSDQISALQHLTNLFLKYFPNKVIYPALGNHEATPCNMFPTPDTKSGNITWLYNELASDWVKTGLPSYLTDNIKNGAFYTLQIAPGLRLISLNMNYCPLLNFWLFINSTDPLGQLKWLANTLQESESKGEKVHLIGHIHPSGCMESWSLNYYRIVNRYESTIVGQFFGHTHKDQFELFYDLNNYSRPVGMAYITGSVTTFSLVNPGYRIYVVDGNYSQSTWQVLDHENYITNLTEANLIGKPVWKKEYSAKDVFGQYGLKNLFPNDWNNLLNQVKRNISSPAFDMLRKFYFKSSDAIPSCDSACKQTFLCSYKQALTNPIIPC